MTGWGNSLELLIFHLTSVISGQKLVIKFQMLLSFNNWNSQVDINFKIKYNKKK